MVEISIGFEAKVGEEWLALTPPVLNRARPPGLRLAIRHQGEAGSFPLSSEQIQCSVPWLGFDASKVPAQGLQAGQVAHLVVNRLKVPGRDDTAHEARVVLKGPASGNSSHLTVDQVNLSFVPSPQFRVELDSSEVILGSEDDPTVEGRLWLDRGRVWLQTPPRLVGGWATMELLDEDPDNPLRFPLELDGRDIPSLRFKIHFSPEHLQDIRAVGSENPTALKRNNKMLITCHDRGTRLRLPAGDNDASANNDDVKLEIPLQMSFVLAPEAYLEPFQHQVRRSWNLVSNTAQDHSFSLRLFNGAPSSDPSQSNAGARLPLTVRNIGLKLRPSNQDPAPTREQFKLTHQRPLPWTVLPGERVDFAVMYTPTDSSVEPKSMMSATLELTVTSNDPATHSFYIEFKAQASGPYPGWLTIDLGTSNSCATLVALNRQLTPVLFDKCNPIVPSAVCYLRLVQKIEYEVGQRALERSREPASTRSVALAAKRRLGDSKNLFEIVPLDEPGETVRRQAEAVVEDLYHEVIEAASTQLVEEGQAQHVIERLTITHPSRFSRFQIQKLTECATAALARHQGRYLHQELPPSPVQTVHEPVGASLDFLNDWGRQSQLFNNDEETSRNYSLLVFDFGGGTLDMTLMQVECQRQRLSKPTSEHAFSYRVVPRLLGALGQRWFGGEDVTEATVALVLQGLQKSQCQVLWCGGSQDQVQGHQQDHLNDQELGLRNRSLLWAWCEDFKVALCQRAELAPDAPDIEELELSFPSLYVRDKKGSPTLMTSSQLRRELELPNLEEIQSKVADRLLESAERCAQLCQLHQISSPDVVLHVGQASKLPSVADTLEKTFPQAKHIRPDLLKSCVASGAASVPFPGVTPGVQLSRGIDRPSVRLSIPKDFSLQSTTSRLGIKLVDANSVWFHELIGEGVPIPAQGLRGSLAGLCFEEGPNSLDIVENCDKTDEISVEKARNLSIIHQARFELPEHPQRLSYEDCQLHFYLSPDQSLKVEVEIPDSNGQIATTLVLADLPSYSVGQQY